MVHSRKFCCCLPVRFGVFVLSLVAMLGGGFVAAYGYIQIARQNTAPLAHDDLVAVWIQSVMFTFLAALAVFGFFGCLIKNRRMVSGFAIALAIHLGLSVAAGIYALVSLFKQDPQQAIANCMAGGAPDATTDACRTTVNVMKGVAVAIYVVTWLVQLYAYFIVERYVDQLDDEEHEKHPAVVVPQTVIQVGGPMATTYQQPHYPFTAPGQAMGTPRGGRDASNNV
ncbi:hypothetical protein HYPSUDRAFT_46671 [Hypholoma sublateritium FD-334 SS-4]|uniref:MARVEL domain-containing protein n=1 Tax=Hypholoma sublateritium (strain FD-334 SS-4) TaxID=945553 RepID=A0A0D2NDW3_HYPSF|nr:hypothetical protein HYPSUDRAFT_46671 [Hypholoma sublateritium FD-334 SS-4]